MKVCEGSVAMMVKGNRLVCEARVERVVTYAVKKVRNIPVDESQRRVQDD
jgi:hypothetical protein